MLKLVKRIFLMVFVLIYASNAYSQIELESKYKIEVVSYFSDNKTHYKELLTQGENYILFKENIILISVNGYVVDMLSYSDNESYSGKRDAKIYKLRSA